MGLNQPVLHASNSIRSFGDTAGSTNKTCTDVMGAIVSAKLALRSKASFQNTKTVGHHLPQQRCDYGHCQSFDALRQASPPQGKPTRYRANAGNLFPSRLHSMLNSAESEQFAHIVSWQPHGRCFKVHQPLRFATEVMPLWFHHTKFTSFRRQLNLYGFSRLTTGVDYGGYYHENFLRGHFGACESMVRTRVKGTPTTVFRMKQPNFYEMEPCNADSRNDHLDTSTCLAGTPQSVKSFVDPDPDDTWIPEDLFEAISEPHSDESMHSRSDDTLSITSSPGSMTPRRLSLPNSVFESYVEASPIDFSLLIPASRCMSPLIASKEGNHDEFGDDITFNGRHFYSLDPDLCRW